MCSFAEIIRSAPRNGIEIPVLHKNHANRRGNSEISIVRDGHFLYSVLNV